MTISLTLYGTNVAASTPSTACKLATTTGGTEVTVLTTSPNDGTQNYMEVLSQAGTGTDSSSLPAASGHGWTLDSNILDNQTIPAGNWSATVGLDDSATFSNIGMFLRFGKRSSGGVVTPIGTLTLASQALGASRTTHTYIATSQIAMAFAVGDRLYVDKILKPAGAGTWGADPVHIYVSSNGSAGVANDLQINTPGYTPTVIDQPIALLEKIAVNDSVKADQTQFIIPVEKIAVKESVATTVGLSPVEKITVSDIARSTVSFTTIERVGLFDSVVATNTPVLPSGDPDMQMLNDDAEIMYVVLHLAVLTTALARIFLVRYPPAKVLSEHSIPTSLYVLLMGESFSQIHKLSTVNQVSAFITDNS